jgi:hypothetical protein
MNACRTEAARWWLDSLPVLLLPVLPVVLTCQVLWQAWQPATLQPTIIGLVVNCVVVVVVARDGHLRMCTLQTSASGHACPGVLVPFITGGCG